MALALAGTGTAAWSQSDEEKARAQLKTLQQDINRINREISEAKGHRDSLQQAVKRADLELGRLERDIAANQAEIAATREVASAVLFLASDEASFVNGAALYVDNGWYAKG